MSLQRKKKPQFSIRERMEMIAVLEELEDLVRSHLDKADRNRKGVASIAGDKAAEEILSFADDVANDPRFERIQKASDLTLAIRSFGHLSAYEGSNKLLIAIQGLSRFLAGLEPSNWPLHARVRIGWMKREFEMDTNWGQIWALQELKDLADPKVTNAPGQVQIIVGNFLVDRESRDISEEDFRELFEVLLKISNSMYTLEAEPE